MRRSQVVLLALVVFPIFAAAVCIVVVNDGRADGLEPLAQLVTATAGLLAVLLAASRRRRR